MSILRSKIIPYLFVFFWVTLALHVLAGTHITERTTLQKYGEPDRSCHWNPGVEFLYTTFRIKHVECGRDLPLHSVVETALNLSVYFHAYPWLLLGEIRNHPFVLLLLPVIIPYLFSVIVAFYFPAIFLLNLFKQIYKKDLKPTTTESAKPVDNPE